MLKIVLVMIGLAANGVPNNIKVVDVKDAESCKRAIEAMQKVPEIATAVAANRAAFMCAQVDKEDKGV